MLRGLCDQNAEYIPLSQLTTEGYVFRSNKRKKKVEAAIVDQLTKTRNAVVIIRHNSDYYKGSFIRWLIDTSIYACMDDKFQIRQRKSDFSSF